MLREGERPASLTGKGWWDSAAYKLFQVLVEESDRAVHRGSEVFGDVMVVPIVGVQIGDATCVFENYISNNGYVIPKETTWRLNGYIHQKT